MIGGRLDRLITINELIETQVSGGGLTTTSSAVAINVPARADFMPGSENQESDQRVASERILFAIRYPHSFSVTPKMQVVFEGRTGNIIDASENTKAARRTELIITVEFKDNQ